MNLALIGFGAVTRQFVALLDTRRAHLARRHDLRCRVVGIATGGRGAAINPRGIDTKRAVVSVTAGSLNDLHDPQSGPAPTDTPSFLGQVSAKAADDHLVVIENTPLGLDGGQPGVNHVRTALTAGADVITANKGPAAFAFRELREQASRAGRSFLFEGAVLDGLPVFNLFERSLPSVQVNSFRGVVNTTTNHVLTAMESGLTLEDAVREMQQAGVTEADSSNDIDGWDAAAKTAVLANALMDADITPHHVQRTGLGGVSTNDIRRARATGSRIKLVASGARHDGAVVTRVAPVALPEDDPLAGLLGTAKGLELETDLLGRIQLTKSESGIAHAAYALLADLVEVARRRGEAK